MHFTWMPCPAPGTWQCRFSCNVGEVDPAVLKLGEEIIRRACISRRVLTSAQEINPPSADGDAVREQLCRIAADAGSFLQTAPSRAVLLTSGLPDGIFRACYSVDSGDPCYTLDIYPFAPDGNDFFAHFDLHRAPDELIVEVNSEKAIAEIRMITETVCRENGVSLFCPKGEET